MIHKALTIGAFAFVAGFMVYTATGNAPHTVVAEAAPTSSTVPDAD